MKKTIIILAFVVLISPSPSFATGAVAGATEFTQLLNKALLKMQEKIQLASNIATVAMKVKQTVTDPITALFGSNAGKQIESETQRWLMSGFQGDPLLVLNPEAYIKNTETNMLRNQIALLEANRTASTEGIIINLIKQRRGELSKGSPEPKDPTPVRVQNTLCADNGAELQRIIEGENGVLALGEAGQGNDFNSMYSELCMGDPSNPSVQKKLLAIESSNNFFSWDSWLSRTVEGNNDYTRGVKTALEVQKRMADAAKVAEKESATGFLSDKKCVEYKTRAETDGDGVETGGTQEDCVAWETLKPGESVSKLAEQIDINQLLKPLFVGGGEKPLADDAIKGIVDVFKGIQEVAGFVRDVRQVGQQVADLRGSFDALTGTVSYLGNLGEGGNANTASINYIGTTDTYSAVGQNAFVNRSGVATSTESRDNSTQEERDAVAGPAKNTIKDHQSSVAKAQVALGQIDSYTNQYKNFLDGVSLCAQNIRTSQGYISGTDDPRINNFTSRANLKKTSIYDPVANKSKAVKEKISITNTFLANALTAISDSKNISFILKTFQNYRDAISRGTILPPEVGDTTESLLTQDIPTMQKEINGESDEITGSEPIKTILDECEQYLQEVNSRGGSADPGN